MMTTSRSAGRPCFTIGGLPLCLAEAPDLIAESMGKAFSMSRSTEAADSVVMTAAFRDDDAFAAAIPPFIRERYDSLPENENPVAFTGPDGGFCCLVRNGGTASAAIVDVDGRTLRLECQRLTRGTAPLHFQSVLIPALKHLLLKRGKLLLHAGCVAAGDGRGVLFVGLSGAGKTTTCIALTRAGFRYISDDLVVLSFVDGRPVVEGIREHMNLTRQTIEFFPEFSRFKDEVKRAGLGGKAPVDPVELFGADRMADRAVIDAVMVIVIGRDGPRLEPVNPPAILNVILQNHTFETGMSIPRQSMDILWNILGSVRAFRLMTGPDPTAMGSHVYAAFHDGAPARPAPAPSVRGKHDAAARSKAIDPAAAAALLRAVLGHTLDREPAPTGLVLDGAAELFRHHRLEAHLARWSRDTGTAVPGFDVDRILSNASALALRRAMVTEKVHNALRNTGISSLLLRGPAVAKRFYPDESLRTYRDIDLIIRKDLLLKSADVMLQLGFKADRGLDYWEGHGEWPFTDGETVVELHWEAYPPVAAGTPGLTADDVRSTADRVMVGGTDIPCLSADHLLLSSILHAAYDHQFDRLVRLIDVRQVVKLAAAGIDWPWVEKMVRQTGTALAVQKALACIRSVLPVPVPDSLTDLPVPGLRKTLADLALPNDRIIAGPMPGIKLRRRIFLQAIRP